MASNAESSFTSDASSYTAASNESNFPGQPIPESSGTTEPNLESLPFTSRPRSFTAPRCIPSLSRSHLPEHPTYHGPITGEQAKQILLKQHEPKCYLTRYSCNKKCYVLTVLNNTDQPSHFDFNVDTDKPAIALEGTGKDFETLDDLLRYYENKPLSEDIRSLGVPCLVEKQPPMSPRMRSIREASDSELQKIIQEEVQAQVTKQLQQQTQQQEKQHQQQQQLFHQHQNLQQQMQELLQQQMQQQQQQQQGYKCSVQ